MQKYALSVLLYVGAPVAFVPQGATSGPAAVAPAQPSRTSSGGGLALGTACDQFTLPAGAHAAGVDVLRVATGDLDGDGALDVVAANSGSDDLSVFLGDGTGGLAAATSIPLSATPSALALGDMDNDGVLDAVVAEVDALDACIDRVEVLLGDGNGGFTARPLADVGPHPIGLVLGDLDQDGNLDVVTANAGNGGSCSASQDLSILIGDGAGGFAPASHVDLGTPPRTIALEDFDLDGDADVLVAGTLVFPVGVATVVVGDGTGALAVGATYGVGFDPIDIALGDLDGNGYVDAAVAHSNGNGAIRTLYGHQTGGFTAGTTLFISDFVNGAAIADVGFDGVADVLVLRSSPGELHTFLGDGIGGFTPCPAVSLGTEAVDVLAVDLEDDGDADVIAAIALDDDVALLSADTDPANVFGGIAFPSGAESFADAVLFADSAYGGGPVTTAPFDQPAAALGPPDAHGQTDARTYSIGSGGRLDLAFTDNRLVNSGDATKDLALFESGTPLESAGIGLHPANDVVRDRLVAIGESPDAEGYFDAGMIRPWQFELDLDALFPGFTFAQLAFDAVRLLDDPTLDATAGPSVGPDIDAAGAESSVPVLPNLAVASFVTPAAGLEGQSYSVRWTVRNEGFAAATGAWQDELWLSEDDVLGNGDDVSLGSYGSPVPLAVGEHYDRVTQLTHPEPGTYRFFLVVDAADAVSEGPMEADNAVVATTLLTVVAVPQPNLTVAVQVPTGPVDSGTEITVDYQVTNAGAGDTNVGLWKESVYLTVDNLAPPQTGTLLGVFDNVTLLQAGVSYGNQVQVPLPEDISGDFYVAVVTDSQSHMQESNEADNVAFSPGTFTVDLEPQPDLRPASIVGDSIGSSGTSFSVAWTDENIGTGFTNTSAWSDEVYLSGDTNPSVSAGDVLIGTAVASGALGPSGMHSLMLDPVLPIDLQGDFWVKVFTDATDVVSEFGGALEANNVAVSAQQVSIGLSVTPDLRPDSIVLLDAAPVHAGHEALVSWSVVDEGTVVWELPSLYWNDCVHLSSDDALDAGDAYLGSFGQHAVSPGWSGTTYAKARSVRIPDATPAGTYYLIVSVDEHDAVYEFESDGMGGNLAESNNVLASMPFQVDLVPADLEIAVGAGTVQPPASGAAGQSIALPWTVTNTGAAVTPVASWTDGVWLSDDATLDAGDAEILVAAHSPALGPGASYEVQTTGDVPAVAPGSYFLLFVTDTTSAVFEPGGEGNNVASIPFTVTSEAPDFVVFHVSTTGSASAGAPLSIGWTVHNQGTFPSGAPPWSDAVYISLDSTLDASDLRLGSIPRTTSLGIGGSYQVSTWFPLPLEVSGSWYVIVETDETDAKLESNEANNTGATRMQIDVGNFPANLTVQSVAFSGPGVAGQDMYVSWTVRNEGLGPTNVSTWNDFVYFSLDEYLDPSDVFFGSYAHIGALGAGSSQVVSVPLHTPFGLTGSFFVIVKTNAGGSVYEAGQTADNVATSSGLATLSLPQPSDLRISNVAVSIFQAPFLGETARIRWTTMNDGLNTISGSWSDSFYLSVDTVLDAGDIFVAQIPNTAGSIPPGGTYQQLAINAVPPPEWPGVLPGAYHVLARSDAIGQVPETDESNNVTSTPGTINLGVRQITAGGAIDDVLGDGQSRFYELTATPGDTVRITLTHDTEDAWTELYVREGDVPTLSVYDFASREPGASEQVVTIPNVSASGYFIRARATAFTLNGLATVSTEVLQNVVDALVPTTCGTGLVTFEVTGSKLDHVDELLFSNDVNFITNWPAHELGLVDGTRMFAAADLSTAPTADPFFWRAHFFTGFPEYVFGSIATVVPSPRTIRTTVSLSPSIRKGRSGSARVRIENDGNVNVETTVVVLGTRANESAAGLGDSVVIESEALSSPGFESWDGRDSQVLVVHDLGPTQSVEVPFEISVGEDFAADELVLGVSGKALDPDGYDSLVTVVAEVLRLVVLADPDSTAVLLAHAADSSGWHADVQAYLPPDTTDVHLPDTLPRTGCELVAQIAAAATSSPSYPPGNEVGPNALYVVCANLFEAVFLTDAFETNLLFPSTCGNELSTEEILFAESAAVPAAVVCTPTPTSGDPNEKQSPPGFGTNQQLSNTADFPYTIYFENVAGAAAPASRVVISDELEPTLRASSFRLGDIRFGDRVVHPPEGAVSYETQVDLSNELGVLVDITAGIDAASRRAFWVFQSIDAATGAPPTGDLGFLPPEDGTGRGQGSVEFGVNANTENVTTGTTVQNQAVVAFDVNATIDTNQTSNTIDAEAPDSSVTGTPVPGFLDVVLAFTGVDPPGGSGISDYTIYVSDDGGTDDFGPFQPFLIETSDETAMFSGEFGHKYGFYSIATDNTGLREAPPAAADYVVDFTADCNGNGQADGIDVTTGTSQDANDNLVPDECEIAPYCSAKLNSDGCLPSIGYSGLPTLTGADDFVITASDIVPLQTGFLVWGLAPASSDAPGGGLPGISASPFGGTSCVGSPRTTPAQSSGGVAFIACSGSFQFAFSQAFMASAGLTAGTEVYVQFWYDDPNHPDGSGFGHTDGLFFIVLP